MPQSFRCRWSWRGAGDDCAADVVETSGRLLECNTELGRFDGWDVRTTSPGGAKRRTPVSGAGRLLYDLLGGARAVDSDVGSGPFPRPRVSI